MKEMIRKIVKKIVLFGNGGLDVCSLAEKLQTLEQKIDVLAGELAAHSHSIEFSADTLAAHSNSIQFLADTLAEKSFYIDNNRSNLKQQFFSIKRLQIQLHESLNASENADMNVYQIVPVFKHGDAIGNYALYIKKVLEDSGISTKIYCYDNLSDNKDVESIENIAVTTPNDLILFHMGAENDFSEIIEAFAAKKVLFYHNITPSAFFKGFDEFAENSTKNGCLQVKGLKEKVDVCITDSEYNKSELVKEGYKVPVFVVPIPFEKEDYTGIEDLLVKEKLSDGKKNILFVGRIAPNKKLEDIIAAYQKYIDGYNKDARLIFVGSYRPEDKYYNFLKQKIRPEDDILFTGHIDTAKWITYYKNAHLFLCLSEHEGFCVPLVEAMSYQIPIIAYDSSAVGETLGEGGILLKDKSPEVVAEVINRVFHDSAAVEQMAAAQKEQLRKFDSKKVAEELKSIVLKIAEDK